MAGIADRSPVIHDRSAQNVNKEAEMFTLRIEHAISDFPTWKKAFNRFAEARERAGVASQRIRRAVDEPNHLVIELEFDALESAQKFRQLLHDVVWTNPDASPALVGAPVSRILEPC